MAIDFSKWNAEFGGQQALEDLKKASNNEFNEVPDGLYVCKVEKLELSETKDGRPMIKGMFRIIEGEYKKQCVFYNQVFTRGFPQHKALEFLRSLGIFEESDVDFTGDFNDLNELLLDMSETADADNMTFDIRKEHEGEFTRLTVDGVYS